MTSPWFDAKPPPDVRVLPLVELLQVWAANRSGKEGANVVLGHVCAEEVCRRLSADRESVSHE